MKTIIHFLRGILRVRVEGVELERFLNHCAKARLTVWDIERNEPFALTLTVTKRHYRRLQRLVEKTQCSLMPIETHGLPFFLRRFRGRYALIAGLLFFCVALAIGSRTLMFIDVEGNENVTTAEILSILRQHGVHPGIYTPSVERGVLANKILLDEDALSHFIINFHGVRAEVIVRETIPTPPLLDEKQPTDVIATATGIITHMETMTGQALVVEGETVSKGETLISGLVDIPEPMYVEGDLGTLLVHAKGRIFARTWHTLRAEIPLTAELKEHTGQEKNRYALHILGRRVNFYQNSGISFAKYDKISESKSLALPGGLALPFSLEKETYRAYETNEAPLSEEAAEQLLREQLLADLQKLLPEEGDEVITTDFVTRKADGFLEVTLLAECSQQIGKEVPRREAGGQ